MNPEIRAKWVNGLLDGTRKQCKGWLRSDDSFCVLGVLCDVIEPSGWTGNCYRGHAVSLPAALREAVGLSNDTEATLSQLNDAGMSFKLLATVIESEL